jgi:hypothetical protein
VKRGQRSKLYVLELHELRLAKNLRTEDAHAIALRELAYGRKVAISDKWSGKLSRNRLPGETWSNFLQCDAL